MKQFNAVFTKMVFYNGGMKEHKVVKTIEARTIKSAQNKAKRMEVYAGKKNYVGNLMLLDSVTEA